MTFSGRVHNGVVVLDDSSVLPEGAAVIVHYNAPTSDNSGVDNDRIQVPLVRTGELGSVHLTGERIAEILDQEDAARSRHHGDKLTQK